MRLQKGTDRSRGMQNYLNWAFDKLANLWQLKGSFGRPSRVPECGSGSVVSANRSTGFFRMGGRRNLDHITGSFAKMMGLGSVSHGAGRRLGRCAGYGESFRQVGSAIVDSRVIQIFVHLRMFRSLFFLVFLQGLMAGFPERALNKRGAYRR